MQTPEISERKWMQQTYRHINTEHTPILETKNIPPNGKIKQSKHTQDINLVATSYLQAALVFASHTFGSWGRTGEFQHRAI